MALDSLHISNIMNKNVIVAEQTQNIFDISKIMSENNIGSIVIINDKTSREPIGIVTERDIIKVLGFLEPYQLTTSIKDHMSHPIITLSANASIIDAIKLMHEKKIRRLIILENEMMVGIVTTNDIFKILIENKDLLSTVIENYSPTPQKQMKEEIAGFWFDNIFSK